MLKRNSTADLEDKIESLETENKILRQQYDELRLKYLENLRNYRYSQKANERHKRYIKRLRQTLNQDKPERVTLKLGKKKAGAKLP